MREKSGEKLERPPARKLSFLDFSVHQWTGKTDWHFAFGLSIKIGQICKLSGAANCDIFE